MRTYPLRKSVINRAYVEIYCLHAPEGALDGREIFVGAHRLVSRKLRFRHAGPNHIQAVQGRFCQNALLVASVGERTLRDLVQEMLCHLVTIADLAHPQSDLIFAP